MIVRRGGVGGAGGAGLFGLIFSLLGRRFGWVGILLAVGAYFLISRTNLLTSGAPEQQTQATADDPRLQFVSFVVDDVQKTWTDIFAKSGRTYRHAKLVAFEGATQTGCGYGEAAVGPFYCPLDQQVYLDLAFFRELERRFGAPGDFAQAYVVAHEFGHHVQKLLGLEEKHSNRDSIAVELQADCFAGVWAHSTARRDLLEQGDIQEALGAAAAVGDDTLQKKTQGTVQPETWTHGSAKQRSTAFKRGFDSGDPKACDQNGDWTSASST